MKYCFFILIISAIFTRLAQNDLYFVKFIISYSASVKFEGEAPEEDCFVCLQSDVCNTLHCWQTNIDQSNIYIFVIDKYKIYSVGVISVCLDTTTTYIALTNHHPICTSNSNLVGSKNIFYNPYFYFNFTAYFI